MTFDSAISTPVPISPNTPIPCIDRLSVPSPLSPNVPNAPVPDTPVVAISALLSTVPIAPEPATPVNVPVCVSKLSSPVAPVPATPVWSNT